MKIHRKRMANVMVNCCCPGLLAVLLAQASPAADTIKWVQKPELSFDEQDKKWTVTFAIDSLSDVEVAIIDPDKSAVVRHLAAGVLGPKPPPPLIANSHLQRIEWDGKDDYGNPVRDASNTAVRVRAGMSVSLERIVGGDPYAFYSEEMSDGDHSPWGIHGLEAKSDGNVYVWGQGNECLGRAHAHASPHLSR